MLPSEADFKRRAGDLCRILGTISPSLQVAAPRCSLQLCTRICGTTPRPTARFTASRCWDPHRMPSWMRFLTANKDSIQQKRSWYSRSSPTPCITSNS